MLYDISLNVTHMLCNISLNVTHILYDISLNVTHMLCNISLNVTHMLYDIYLNVTYMLCEILIMLHICHMYILLVTQRVSDLIRYIRGYGVSKFETRSSPIWNLLTPYITY